MEDDRLWRMVLAYTELVITGEGLLSVLVARLMQLSVLLSWRGKSRLRSSSSYLCCSLGVGSSSFAVVCGLFDMPWFS